MVSKISSRNFYLLSKDLIQSTVGLGFFDLLLNVGEIEQVLNTVDEVFTSVLKIRNK